LARKPFFIESTLSDRLDRIDIFDVFCSQFGLKISELFSELFRENFAKFSQFSRVRKARTLPKYFRNSEKVNFRNSRKRKFRKKPSNAGPYNLSLNLAKTPWNYLSFRVFRLFSNTQIFKIANTKIANNEDRMYFKKWL